MGQGFFEAVYEVVKQIPKGRVASYGRVAELCGNKRMARQVGWALHVNPDQSGIPCHRVVNKRGGCCEGFAFGGREIQEAMLVAEGVKLTGGFVDMDKYSI